MRYCIYKITNIITGKAYIGKTTQPEKRPYGHKHAAGGCRYLHNSIKKYGWDNFKYEIISEFTNQDDLAKAENEFIISHNTLAPNGYNLVLENDGKNGRTFSQESKELRSHVHQKRERDLGSGGYIGVYKASKSTFAVQISVDRKRSSKSYSTALEGAIAYDKLSIHLHGKDARINFPEKLEEYLKEDLEQFFQDFRVKRKKASKYEFIWFHKRHKKWVAAAKIEDKIKALGQYLSEEEAYQAQLKFLNTGVYEPNTPDKWNYPSTERKSLLIGRLFLMESPNGEKYQTCSLMLFAKAFKMNYDPLLRSVHLGNTTRNGWKATKIQMTEEIKQEFEKISPEIYRKIIDKSNPKM